MPRAKCFPVGGMVFPLPIGIGFEKVPVIVSEQGAQANAYGQYFGDGVAREMYEDRIVIYRDTLERDFGHDRQALAREVDRTLRHELAHHLGWDESGVGDLGL